MRKALIGLLVAATAVTPVALSAAPNDRWGGHSDRQEGRAASQSQRGESRSERQAPAQPRQNFQRAERQAPVQAQQNYQRVNREGRNFGRDDSRRSGIARQTFVDRRDDRSRSYQAQNRDRGSNWQNSRNDRNDSRWNGSQNRNWDRGDRNRHGNDRRWNRGDRDHNWNHNWRNDHRYDWQRYRYSNRSRFHMPRYYSPYRGYGYNRFSIGYFLEPLFYSSNYWISDPWQYRLPPAYPGTRWVRYYDDVLLVDTYTGEVVDVIYDFFW